MIDDGGEAVLVLAHDHPGNEERKNLKIFISQVSNGLYRRKLHHTDEDAWASPQSTTLTWEELLGGSSGIEATSDQWSIRRKNTSPHVTE